MSTRMAPRMIQVTFRYPDGSVRLAAPADVPLGELMPDFLDLAEQPDGDGWVLGADGVHAYPAERTLAELGVLDGGVLVLHRHPEGPPSSAPTRRDAHSAPPDSPAARSGRCASGPPARCRRSSRGPSAPGSPSAPSQAVGRAATLPSLPARAFPARGRSPAPRAPPPWAGRVRRGATPTISTGWMS